jgi:hypothetical protein
MVASAARSLRHLAAAMEDAATVRQALTDEPGRTAARAKPKAAKRRSREDTWLAQQRGLRTSEERMHEAHRERDLARDFASRRTKAAPDGTPPDSGADARINAIAESYYARRR